MAPRSQEIPPGFVLVEPRNPFAELLGPIYEQADDDGFRRGFRVSDKHLNTAGIAHGGMLMTFADILMGQAIRQADAFPAVTIRMTTDFTAPARLGDWVDGTGRATRVTRSMVFVEAEIAVNGRLSLTASGLFQRLGRRHG